MNRFNDNLSLAGIGEKDSGRKGDWIQTFTGRRFWPLDPRPEDVDIRDIAHSLACQSRFAGHCREPYSIAQHCVFVSGLVEVKHSDLRLLLWGLLHDASEAYLCDLPRPLKRDPEFGFYCAAEQRVTLAVQERYGLSRLIDLHPAVQRADAIALRTEARDLMNDPHDWTWPTDVTPWPVPITPWDWRKAEEHFLARFEELT